MEIPIRDYESTLGLEAEAPNELKDFCEKVEHYRQHYQNLGNALNWQTNIEEIIKDSMNVLAMLDYLIWDYVSLVKKTVEQLNKEDKPKEKPKEKKEENGEEKKELTAEEKRDKVVKILENDMINYMGYLNTSIDSTFSQLPEKITKPKLFIIHRNLSIAFNSLLGITLIEAWKKSRKEKPKYERSIFGSKYEYKQRGTEWYCEPKIFYRELYNSVKTHVGVFRRQLFILGKGKIQQVFMPTASEGEKSFVAQKLPPIKKVKQQKQQPQQQSPLEALKEVEGIEKLEENEEPETEEEIEESEDEGFEE